MDDQMFQKKFSEIMGHIQSLPGVDRCQLERLANETRARRDRLQSSVNELQESLDHLRLTVKYLVFDLEATRRENAYLRKMLEQANRDANSRGRNEFDADENEDD